MYDYVTEYQNRHVDAVNRMSSGLTVGHELYSQRDYRLVHVKSVAARNRSQTFDRY